MKQHRYKQFKQFDFSKNNPLVKKVLSINYILNLFKKKKRHKNEIQLIYVQSNNND